METETTEAGAVSITQLLSKAIAAASVEDGGFFYTQKILQKYATFFI